MNIQDLSPSQLRRAAAIKERLDRLNKALGAILGAPNSRATRLRIAAKAKKKMSAATRAKLRAKLKAYWAAKKAGRR